MLQMYEKFQYTGKINGNISIILEKLMVLEKMNTNSFFMSEETDISKNSNNP